MKTRLLTTIIILSIISCTEIKEIGKVNMISNRNVESNANYIIIKSYAGAGTRELKNNKAPNVEQAIDNVVRNVAGGEFLKNAKIYLIDGVYYSVEGDVWGIESNANYKGFKVKDKVNCKSAFENFTGKIISLKDDTYCIVETENGDIKTVRYDALVKLE